MGSRVDRPRDCVLRGRLQSVMRYQLHSFFTKQCHYGGEGVNWRQYIIFMHGKTYDTLAPIVRV